MSVPTLRYFPFRPFGRVVLLLLLLPAILVAIGAEVSPPSNEELMKQGNFKDALVGFRQVIDNTASDGRVVANSLASAVDCLGQLNRQVEFDALVENAIAKHATKWQVLQAAADQYLRASHYGFMIAGEFRRGFHRGGGRQAWSAQRDRVHAIQLLRQAYQAAEGKAKASSRADIAASLARAIFQDRSGRNAWQLQALTNLDELPDFEQRFRTSQSAAPVDAEGEIVLYELPKSWESANSDGERWRWALATMTADDPSYKFRELTERAAFASSQFGVGTLEGMQALVAVQDDAQENIDPQAKLFLLHTLKDNECLARLATGVRRFELSAEFHPILLFQQALEFASSVDRTADAASAAAALANIHTDRRQFSRAADYWRQIVEWLPNGPLHDQAIAAIAQIEKPWGQFGFTGTQPAKRGAEFRFRFRNANRVEFTAHKIKIDTLIADLKAYLKSNPKQVDWQQAQIDQIGYRLVDQQQEKYVGDEAAKWGVDLDSPENHFDREITITSPLQNAGAYLVTANMADGNTAKIVLWVADTAIVKKPLEGATLYYVADAVTGQPVAGANVEMFGYRVDWKGGNRPTIGTRSFAEKSDASGQVVVAIDEKQEASNYNWLAIARTDDGRLAHLGFHGVWRSVRDQTRPTRNAAFAITDRPVYRPGQQVNMKVWVERTAYDAPLDKSAFAHQQFQLEIRDPKGDVIVNKQVTANAFGGVAADYELPTGAALGVYSFSLANYGGGSFRVEEYKKPEFEVTVDAPSDPVALGEKFTAKVSARYYFGSPVESGTLKYKVTRTPRNSTWFPPTPWDWLYGEGYWWFATDSEWYPGFARWGCRGPSPWWFWQPTPEPEIVAEGTTELTSDGTYSIEIDTAIAKALHPDSDHAYRIEAEVVDPSRRTIVGSGEVIVAREPFQVFVWTNRGFYKTGDTITANFAARRADGKPVAGKGTLKLYRISYPETLDGEPEETEVRDWQLATDADGRAEIQIKASEPGRYRLGFTVTDDAKRTIEGAQLLTIVGEEFDGNNFEFNDLELVPDARNYEPGESLKLQINTNRVGSRVLLFVRAQDGVYPKPQFVTLKGKSTIVEIPIDAADSPNFFVEAVTVAGGKVHVVAKQIAVPPANRIVNVEVQPSSDVYRPGQEAKVTVKLTGGDGAPIVGDTVLTVYDRALEYISGGSNVGDIREVFWGWKRNHNPTTEHNLARGSGNLTPKGQTAMQWLGRFGYLVETDETDGRRSLEKNRDFGVEGMAGGAVTGRAMPMSVAAPLAEEGAAADGNGLDFQSAKPSEGRSDRGGNNALVEPRVRQNFADTAFWGSSIETGADGLGEVTFTMPENTTDWSFKLWGMGHGAQVGDASASAVTRKDLMVRLQTPRFLVDRDEVVLSANVHNYLKTEKQVRVKLELEGDCLSPMEDTTLEVDITIPADGQQRVDWRVKAASEGTAIVRALALTDEESDAMQLEVPVKVHGAPKLIPHSGVIAKADERDAFEVTIPEARKVEQTELVVQYSPTLAGAMVDALPYLIDYPYGCTEQTLNRFLPAVLTQRAIQKMGVDLKELKEKRNNLNPQELGDPAERAAQWQRFDTNPVFDQAELDKVVKAGLERLTEMQLEDGGWGWFSGWGERSSAHTTATVVRGLLIAQKNDLAIVPGVVERGVEWLADYQKCELAKLDNYRDGKPIDKDKPSKSHADNLDAFVHLVLVDAGQPSDKMREYLYRDRTKLSVYCLAQLGLALLKEGGHDEQLEMVMQNLSQFVVTDAENQTAYLNLPGGSWWNWYGSEFEAQAYYLKLLAAREPNSDMAAGMVKYLLNNRKHATYWNSTRDTALVVEAMADYLAATGEGKNEMVVEVWLNGQRQKTVEITPETLFTFDNRFVVVGADLEAGRHTVELRKQGEGRLYYNAYLSLFSLEDDIQAAGLEIKVNRKLYKLTRKPAEQQTAGGRGQVVDEKIERYDRTEITNLGTVESGDLVEVELTIESKNDYEYMIFEDFKPAGCEPMEVRSGYNGNELGAYVEYRDDRVAMFVQRLARGTHSVSYRLRAEIPGRFSALPTQASAMYAPELRANSDEVKVKIVDSVD